MNVIHFYFCSCVYFEFVVIKCLCALFSLSMFRIYVWWENEIKFSTSKHTEILDTYARFDELLNIYVVSRCIVFYITYNSTYYVCAELFIGLGVGLEQKVHFQKSRHRININRIHELYRSSCKNGILIYFIITPTIFFPPVQHSRIQWHSNL